MRTTALLVGVILPAVALATSIVPHTLADRARVSDRVAVVQVLQRWTESAPGEPKRLKTFTRVSVGEEIKGTGPREVTIVQLGGRDGSVEQRIPGDADFAVGETALVFLTCKQERCWLVALGEGKVAISGDEAFVRDLFTGAWSKRPVRELVRELRAAVAPPVRPGAPQPTGVTR